jgi:two-component system, OmpR family, sensor histidine kinase CpxA
MLLKIFLTFWVTVALLAAGQELLSITAQAEEQRGAAEIRSMLDQAQPVVDAYAHGGVEQARAAAAVFEQRRGVTPGLLDAAQQALIGSSPRPAVAATAQAANRAAAAGSTSAAANVREGAGARQVALPDGRRVTLVIDVPRHLRPTATQQWTLSRAVRLGAIGAIGGLLCFALARHFSTPLVRLGRAANALADGRLDTRVGPVIGRRRDEVGALARDFDRMAERLEALVAGQRRLLGEVSHELRSPLARLVVAMGLARRTAGDAGAEYFDRIEREVSRLDRLIEQLLTLARIESAVDDQLRGAVNLTELVQETAADGDFEGRAQAKRVVVGRADGAQLTGRSDLLRSAIENVVRNAVRHTPAGTAVDVTLERVEQDGAARGILNVRDRGPGVDAALLPELFKRFWRAPQAGAASDGSGLGLAIAERVVTMHDGRISAANAIDGGLIVTLDLPLTREPRARGADC